MLSKFGIECFRSEGNCSLVGQLKESPSDFVVREINLDGKIAGVSLVGDPIDASKKPKLTSENSSADDTAVSDDKAEIPLENVSHPEGIPKEELIPETTGKKEGIDWPGIYENPKLHLSTLIGEENFQKLSDIDASSSDDLEITLGCFNKKNDRSILHQCIRFLFPFIRSSTRKVGNNTELVCKIDNVHVVLVNDGLQPDKANDLLRFVHCRLVKGTLDVSEEFRVDVTSFNRQKRKKLHGTIHNKFGKFMESKTLVRNEKHWISVRFKEKKQQQLTSNKRSHEIDVYCATLTKKNMEHLHALREVTRAVDGHLSAISHAGIKDKKAITYQFITLKHPIKLAKIQKASNRWFGEWKISDPTVVEKEIQLGDLAGNQFEIIVRNVKAKEPDERKSLQESIENAINNIQCNGFINYYGEQRFGLDLISVNIGALILKGKIKEAVEMMFQLSPSTEIETSPKAPFIKAKEMIKTGDYKRALGLIPHYKSRERLVLKGIIKFSFNEDGCAKGFLNLPYASRLFYVHSYCSYVWNQAVTKRIQQHGYQILPGDLVLNHDGEPKHVGQDDIERGLYTFNDIVFPLPGTNVQLPENGSKDVYLQLLSKEQLELKDFYSKKLRLNNISGSYRKVVEFVKDLTWKLVTNECGDNNMELNFSLSPSTYATMAVREILQTK